MLRCFGMTFSNLPRPILVLIRGLPGSGKSYLASALQRSIDGEIVALDPDATDYQSPAYLSYIESAAAAGVDPSLFAYRYLRQQAYDGITAHKLILWNQPFTNREIFQKMTAGLQNFAATANTKLDILVVEVNVAPTAAHQRIAERQRAGGHGPSNATFNRFSLDYVSFAEEGFPTITVDGLGDITKSVTSVLTAVSKLAATS